MRARLRSHRVLAVAAALVAVVLLGACGGGSKGGAAPTTASAKPPAPSTTYVGQNGCRNVALAAVERAFPGLANVSLTVGGPGICFVQASGTQPRSIWIVTDVGTLWAKQASQPSWKVVQDGAYEVGTSSTPFFGGTAGTVSDVWLHNDAYSVRISAHGGTPAFRQLQSPAGVLRVAALGISVLEAVSKNG